METEAKKSGEGRDSEESDGKTGGTTKSKGVSSETKAKVTHTLLLPITVPGPKRWAVEKADREKNMDSFEIQRWRRTLRYLWLQGR